MKIKRIIAICGAIMLFANTVFANESQRVQPIGMDSSYEIFTKLMTYASQLYIDETITPEELINNAFEKAIEENPEFLNELLKAGFSSLDEYSEYYTAEEFVEYINNMNHIFYGIGVVIQKKEEYIEITQCMEDGSAYAAGILPGDRIYKVDGESAVGISLDKVQGMITGELGTKVSVTVLRDDKEITFELERMPVSDTTVYTAVFEGNIGYIGVVNFAQKTDYEFENALKTFDEQGVTNIILDLRYNPGGYLVSAVNIAEMIVPEGVIVQTMFRQEEKNETFYSELKNPKYKFAVLVNQDTASAAEVLAGAMQDSGIGVLFGETTYGKAVIQEMYRMADGAFKITTGHYLTRNGHEINKKGIEPDEYVVNTKQWVDMSKYTPFDYKIKWRVGDESDSVRAAKERLKGLGYYSGIVDNKFDEELAEAVTEFQAATELFPYGVLDISTQVRIENEFYHTEEVVDRQFQEAYKYFGGDVENLNM